jgi:hypothetical protein
MLLGYGWQQRVFYSMDRLTSIDFVYTSRSLLYKQMVAQRAAPKLAAIQAMMAV